jgi:hypothetical protein
MAGSVLFWNDLPTAQGGGTAFDFSGPLDQPWATIRRIWLYHYNFDIINCKDKLRGMTNWRSIQSAPKDGRELTVRRTVSGITTYEVVAIWRAATANSDKEGWVDAHTGEPVPEPTHWKATGRGHPY